MRYLNSLLTLTFDIDIGYE